MAIRLPADRPPKQAAQAEVSFIYNIDDSLYVNFCQGVHRLVPPPADLAEALAKRGQEEIQKSECLAI